MIETSKLSFTAATVHSSPVKAGNFLKTAWQPPDNPPETAQQLCGKQKLLIFEEEEGKKVIV